MLTRFYQNNARTLPTPPLILVKVVMPRILVEKLCLKVRKHFTRPYSENICLRPISRSSTETWVGIEPINLQRTNVRRHSNSGVTRPFWGLQMPRVFSKCPESFSRCLSRVYPGAYLGEGRSFFCFSLDFGQKSGHLRTWWPFFAPHLILDGKRTWWLSKNRSSFCPVKKYPAMLAWL